MDNAALYDKSNTYQRIAIKKVIDKFAPLMHWIEDGSDSVLDIGCGSGDVTVELILPALPAEFNRLLGCDISDEMVKYARQHYRHPKVTFEQLDIKDNVDEFRTKFGPFDHIVSFFCLNWVIELNEAFNNIHKLLTPNGDCLLMFLTSSNTFTVYAEMSTSEKWSKYMKDVQRFIPVYQNTEPVADLRLLCKSVGLACLSIETDEASYVCENYEEYKDFFRSINPFLKRMPINEQEEFTIDQTERLIVKNKEANQSNYLLKCKTITIHAKKV